MDNKFDYYVVIVLAVYIVGGVLNGGFIDGFDSNST